MRSDASKSTWTRKMLAGAVAGVFVAVSSVPGLANPAGGTVVAGSATIATAPKTVTVDQTSNRAIINWQGFSIGPGQTTIFQQPSSTAAVLNRVTSSDPSEIYGSLESNGQVYLLNPNGILIGPNGQIATGAFIASTLGADNAAFMAGGQLNLFGTSSAPILNLGTIQASSGDVALFAAQVSNQGTILAPNGTAALGSGSNILYAPGDDDEVLIQAPAAAPASGASVDNAGTIAAAVAELKAAGSPYALAVNNGGQISATTVTNAGGRVLLDGGSGETVDTGTIHADANGNGNGGSVVVTGGNTTMSGTITARGGSQGGNGGSVEISGNTLQFPGSVDVSAPYGTIGSLLLDPTTIDTSAASGIVSSLGTANVDVVASDSITVDAAISASACACNTSLTLDAPTLAIDAPITLGGATGNTLVLQNSSGTSSGSSLTSASDASLTAHQIDVIGFDTTTLNGSLDGLLGIGGTGFTATSFTATNTSNAIPTLTFGSGTFTSGNSGAGTFSSGISPGSVIAGTGAAFSGAVSVYSGPQPMAVSGQPTANSFTLTSGSDLTLNAGTVLTTTGGNTTVGADGTQGGGVFANDAGTGVFAGPGRKIVYSTTDGTDTTGTGLAFNDGGLSYPDYYGFAYGSDPVGSGNEFYILNSTTAPVLTITPNDASWVYGSPNPSGISYSTTTSNGSTPGSISGLQFNVGSDVNAGRYPIDPSGALIAGYVVDYGTGTLTITPAPLYFTVNNASMTQGGSLPSFSASFSGLVNGDGPSVVSGMVFSTTATSSSAPGNYPIQALFEPYGTSGAWGIAQNYTLMPSASPDGTLTVNAALQLGPVIVTTSIPTSTELNAELQNASNQANAILNSLSSDNADATVELTSSAPPLFGSAAAEQYETSAITAVEATLSGTALTTFEEGLAPNESTINPSAYEASLAQILPYLYQDLTTILNTPSGQWTTEQSDFVEAIENYINAQRFSAAQQADEDYANYLAAQNISFENSANSGAGNTISGIYISATEASNPTIPPQSFIQEAQAGLVLTNSQVSTLGGTLTNLSDIAQQTADANQAAGDLMLGFIQANDASFSASTIQQELDSGNASQVQSAVQTLQSDASSLGLTLPSFTDAQIAQQITTNYQAAGETPNYVPGTSVAVGKVAQVVGTAIKAGNYSTQSLPSGTVFESLLKNVPVGKGGTVGGTSNAIGGASATISKTDKAEVVTNAGAGEEAGEGAAELAGDALATGGAILEVVGTVVTIAVSAAQYVSLDNYNSSFDSAIAAAEAPVTLSQLQAMAAGTQSTGPNLLTYLSAMLNTNGSVNTLSATSVQAGAE